MHLKNVSATKKSLFQQLVVNFADFPKNNIFPQKRKKKLHYQQWEKFVMTSSCEFNWFSQNYEKKNNHTFKSQILAICYKIIMYLHDQSQKIDHFGSIMCLDFMNPSQNLCLFQKSPINILHILEITCKEIVYIGYQS